MFKVCHPKGWQKQQLWLWDASKHNFDKKMFMYPGKAHTSLQVSRLAHSLATRDQ